MKILIAAIIFLAATIQPVSAAIYQQGIIYVIYDEEGANAVKNKADVNSNGVPDVIEDIATQVNATRDLFKNVFKYPDPLESERFKGVTSFEIEIESRTTLKYPGMSFSGIRQNSMHNPKEKAVHFKIASDIDPHKSSIPSHEYFHFVQYGATYFRNRWFLEGMATWAQDSTEKIKYPNDRSFTWKLNNDKAQEKIFNGKYDMAQYFWFPLAISLNDKAKIPSRLIKKYKCVDGASVFQDNVFYGANIMREVIKVMQSKENAAAAKFGGVNKWRKDGQRADQNNEFILASVREVYNSKKK